MSSILSPIQLITSNFPSILTVFRTLFTRNALGDVDLRFSLILVTKASTVERGTTSAAWLYDQRYQATHVTDGMGVTSFSAASNTRQVRPGIDSVCWSLWTEIYRVNWKRGVNFHAALQRNRAKKERKKERNCVKRELLVQSPRRFVIQQTPTPNNDSFWRYLRRKKDTVWRPCRSFRPIFHLSLISATKQFLGFFMKFHTVLSEKLSRKREFRENRLSDSHTLLNGVNGCLHLLSVFENNRW